LRQNVYKRLEGLEKISAAMARRAGLSPADQQKLDNAWAKVQAWHADPKNQQCLAERPPGFMQTRVQELKQELLEIANGRRRGAWA